MPVSAKEGKKEIKKWVKDQHDIQMILDIGSGAGTYYDLLGDKYHWTGIEIFDRYVEKYGLMGKYDEMIVGDARRTKLPEADLIIFGDVLEHMDKHEAIDLVKKSDKYKHCIASVPVGYWPQGPVDGNQHETHRSSWSMRELEETLFPEFPIKLRCGSMGIFIR